MRLKKEYCNFSMYGVLLKLWWSRGRKGLPGWDAQTNNVHRWWLSLSNTININCMRAESFGMYHSAVLCHSLGQLVSWCPTEAQAPQPMSLLGGTTGGERWQLCCYRRHALLALYGLWVLLVSLFAPTMMWLTVIDGLRATGNGSFWYEPS